MEHSSEVLLQLALAAPVGLSKPFRAEGSADRAPERIGHLPHQQTPQRGDVLCIGTARDTFLFSERYKHIRKLIFVFALPRFVRVCVYSVFVLLFVFTFDLKLASAGQLHGWLPSQTCLRVVLPLRLVIGVVCTITFY